MEILFNRSFFFLDRRNQALINCPFKLNCSWSHVLYQVALTSSDLIVSLFSLVSHFVEVHKYIPKSFHSGVSHPFEWLPLGNYLIGWKAWSCLFAQACHGWAFRRAIRGAERLPDCSWCRERIDSTWTFVCFFIQRLKDFKQIPVSRFYWVICLLSKSCK